MARSERRQWNRLLPLLLGALIGSGAPARPTPPRHARLRAQPPSDVGWARAWLQTSAASAAAAALLLAPALVGAPAHASVAPLCPHVQANAPAVAGCLRRAPDAPLARLELPLLPGDRSPALALAALDINPQAAAPPQAVPAPFPLPSGGFGSPFPAKDAPPAKKRLEAIRERRPLPGGLLEVVVDVTDGFEYVQIASGVSDALPRGLRSQTAAWRAPLRRIADSEIFVAGFVAGALTEVRAVHPRPNPEPSQNHPCGGRALCFGQQRLLPSKCVNTPLTPNP